MAGRSRNVCRSRRRDSSACDKSWRSERLIVSWQREQFASKRAFPLAFFVSSIGPKTEEGHAGGRSALSRSSSRTKFAVLIPEETMGESRFTVWDNVSEYPYHFARVPTEGT